MEKWEYKIDAFSNAEGESDIINWLNYLGQNGWELINYDVKKSQCVLIDVKGIFKRKIQQLNG